MNKKILVLSSCVFLSTGLLFSCGNTAHEHTYSSSWFSDSKTHWHASTCEHNLKKDEADHIFTSKVIAPTANSMGYTQYTCRVCEYSYKDNYIEKLNIAYQLVFDFNGGTSATYSGTSYTKTVKSFSKDDFIFDLTKDGYNFRGWEYKGNKVIDEKGNIIFTPTMEANMKFTAIFIDRVNLTITTNMKDAGTINGQGEYPFNTNVDVSVVVNQGYKFIGWYYQNTLLSQSLTYKYMMWDKDITLEARFSLESYTLNISSNNSTYGLVAAKNTTTSTYRESYRLTYQYTKEVTIAAYTQTDIRFLGWYNEEKTKVSNNAVYSFSMPNYNYNLKAIWNYFKISYSLNGGTNNSNNSDHYSLDDIPTLYSPTKSGTGFYGWKYKDEIITSIDPNWMEDVTLEAVWDNESYTITYELNGGTNSSNNPKSFTIGSGCTLSEPTKKGYTFLGWYNGDEKVTKIPRGTCNNITLTAKWTPTKNSLNILSSNSTRGNVQIVKGSGYTDEEIIVKALPIGEYIFDGWYKDNTLVSSKNEYTFIMPSESITLTARFLTKAEEEEERKIAQGITPVFDNNNNTVTYGLYPQSHVGDTTLIGELNKLTKTESNGWYLYDDIYYAKLTAKPYNSSYTFDDNTTIESNTTYWFKCEPIVWKILETSNNTYTLLSTVLLDAHRYDDASNNYANSEIREWLNSTFLNSAFKLDSSLIETTNVDNSASTTNSSSNSYACSNTNDKIYLLSYQDYLKSSYGFSTSTSSTTTRECKTTDYARANGAYYNNSSSYLYNGYYWTRSPFSYYSNDASGVSSDGYLGSYYLDVYRTGYSVRPSLQIKVTE